MRMRTVPCRSHAASTLAGWRFKSRKVNDWAAEGLDRGFFDSEVGFDVLLMSDILTDILAFVKFKG